MTGERSNEDDLRERIGDAHKVVYEAQRLAYELLESSGATGVEHEQRTAEQQRLVSLYSFIHDGVKRLAGRRDVDLPSLEDAQILVTEYRVALAAVRVERDALAAANERACIHFYEHDGHYDHEGPHQLADWRQAVKDRARAERAEARAAALQTAIERACDNWNGSDIAVFRALAAAVGAVPEARDETEKP